MIVVFVVDTSPSMGQPLVGDGSSERSSGMSRLDLAKMTVESLAKGLRKRVSEHNGQFQQETAAMQQSLHNLGLGHCPNDQFLLLSTGRQKSQHPGTAACGAGGRLLVGYGDSMDFNADNTIETPLWHGHRGGFDRSLKQLRATPLRQPFPEDGGGAVGLNTAMNAGIKLMSRYRLNNRNTENFGLGRLPSSVLAVNALMPACLILLTDLECLRKSAADGGGLLQLQYGTGPLREFYQEPFRWDQRIFCVGVGAPEGVASSQYIPDDLRRLCDVTGGSHTLLRSTTCLPQVVDSLLKLIAPPRPRVMPVAYPLRTTTPLPPASHSRLSSGLFVNGGPICCFQSLEVGANGEPSPTRRAMLLYVPYEQPQTTPSVETSQVPSYSPPIWCIPEAYFPSRMLDSLPPRLAQPLLRFSGNYSVIGSNTFDPEIIMKLLQRLDHLTLANRKLPLTASTGAQQQPPVKLLQRDVYICEWLTEDGKIISLPKTQRPMEYFPVCVQGAGRPLSEGDEHYLNIGILHVPLVCQTNITLVAQNKVCTLTLLPPEPQILLPLLVKAAEAEHRIVRKASDVKEVTGKSGAGLIQKQVSSSGPKAVPLDEHWRSDFRAYMFRIPPYYHNALKRSLRPILPASVQSLLNLEGNEAVASQCFSKVCLQKIRNGEQVARDTNERLERQEADLRCRVGQAVELPSKTAPNARQPNVETVKSNHPVVGYGQYDPRDSTTSFLAALRTMPAPWRVRGMSRAKEKDVSIVEKSSQGGASDTVSIASLREPPVKTVVDILGDLPADCLVPYYESRRRWIFGGSGLTTRGLHVEGVNNDGSNVQHYDAHQKTEDESLLSLAGVGASTLNMTTTAKMGDFRERLLWSRAPVVGYGSNDAAGVSATTSPDGSPKWSVDDDALPMSFFNQRTGEFTDSVQARVSSRLMVNFGNPYKDKRGDAIVPEAFLNQSPSFKRGGDDVSSDEGPLTPPGSPPHDAFTSSEGEDEALFAGKPARRPRSPRHHGSAELSMDHDSTSMFDGKRPHDDNESSRTETPEDTTIPHKKTKVISESPFLKKVPQATTQRPPPPPKPPQKQKPPPPPPRPPPRPPAEKCPVSSDTQLGATKPPAPTSAPVDKPRPAEGSLSTDEPAKITDQTEKKASDVQSPDSKPKVDLPPGWMCVWSKSQKRWYFFDTKTNKSVWQWPPPASGLKWMLQSKSVVLMPPPTRTSWAMEELLEPWVHYIPMLPDGSNAEEIVQWALDNEKEARRIAERATLFMYDLVYHPDAASDDRKIQEEMARRYRTLWH